jgi:hypothetical protein
MIGWYTGHSSASVSSPISTVMPRRASSTASVGAVSNRVASATPSLGGSVVTRTTSVSAAVSSRASRCRSRSIRRPPSSSTMSSSPGAVPIRSPIAPATREMLGSTWFSVLASSRRRAPCGVSHEGRTTSTVPFTAAG